MTEMQFILKHDFHVCSTQISYNLTDVITTAWSPLNISVAITLFLWTCAALYCKDTNLRQKLAEVADLDTQSLDLLFHCFLVAVFSIQHPQRLIILHMYLSVNH